MREPQRILMTADTIGGVWTYALELIQALQPYGVEVLLATLGAPLSPDQRSEVQKLSNARVAESAYKLEWMSDPWADVSASGEWLLKLADEFRPDLIHLNGYCHGALPWDVPTVVVAHSCVLSWWRAVKGEDVPPEWNDYRNAVRTGLQHATRTVAPSRAMLLALREHYGIAGGEVIPNGRSAQAYQPGIKEDFVLGAGRLWDEAKNIALLERVAPRLPWPVYVAGESKHPGGRDFSGTRTEALGQLTGSDLARWYARAAVFASPARYEPFGLSILEAALSGCALVLSDINSLRENWDGAAEFVNADDADGFAAALKRLACDPRRRAELAGRGRARALQFSPRAMAAQYVRLYGTTLALEHRSVAAP